MDVLDGGGDGEVGGHGLHHLGHGLDLQPVGSDQRLLLLLERSVALVHGAELVAAAPHAVGPYGWTDRNREGRGGTGQTPLALTLANPPLASSSPDCKATFPTPTGKVPQRAVGNGGEFHIDPMWAKGFSPGDYT